MDDVHQDGDRIRARMARAASASHSSAFGPIALAPTTTPLVGSAVSTRIPLEWPSINARAVSLRSIVAVISALSGES